MQYKSLYEKALQPAPVFFDAIRVFALSIVGVTVDYISVLAYWVVRCARVAQALVSSRAFVVLMEQHFITAATRTSFDDRSSDWCRWQPTTLMVGHSIVVARANVQLHLVLRNLNINFLNRLLERCIKYKFSRVKSPLRLHKVCK